MNAHQRERLNYLCARIQLEQAPKAFEELVMELNELLEQKQQRIDSEQPISKTIIKN
jgi:hypothetical protein